MASSISLQGKEKGKYENNDRFYFLILYCGWWLQPWNQKLLVPWKESYDKPRQHIKKQRHHFADKRLFSQTYGIPHSHMWMWELDLQEGWIAKNLWFWTVVLEKTLESPLDCQEIKPVNPKGNEPWMFIWRVDAEDDAPIHWLPDAKRWLFGRLWCWKRWKAKEKGMAENEMVR